MRFTESPDVLKQAIRSSVHLNGFHDADDLDGWRLDGLGQSQAAVTRADRAQKELGIRIAEIAAADQKVWDTIWAELQKIGGWIPRTRTQFVGWQWGQDKAVDHINNVFVKYGKSIPEKDLSDAEAFNALLKANIDYYKTIHPEMASQVAASSDDMRRRLEQIGPLESPDSAAWKTFKDELERRAKIGFGIAAGALLAVGAGLFLLSKSGRGSYKSNPKKKDDFVPYLLAGGIGYAILSKKVSAASSRASVTTAAMMPAVIAPPSTSYPEAIKRLDDLITLWRSGEIPTALEATMKIDQLRSDVQSLYSRGTMTGPQRDSLMVKISSFRKQVAG